MSQLLVSWNTALTPVHRAADYEHRGWIDGYVSMMNGEVLAVIQELPGPQTLLTKLTTVPISELKIERST